MKKTGSGFGSDLILSSAPQMWKILKILIEPPDPDPAKKSGSDRILILKVSQDF
jgi:hypothetical protein